MSWEPGCDPATDSRLVGSRPACEAPAPVDAAVLVLLAGRPLQVLLVRKSCSLPGRWACDVALPGGRVEEGECPVDTALREAWEEAGVPPWSPRVLGVMGVEETRIGRVRVAPVVAVERGPLEPRPASEEVDAVFWVYLREVASRRPRPVRHPRRGVVEGLTLPGGLVLWGLTLRILRRLPGYLEARAGATP